MALAIDAKDSSAARWYERFGSLSLLDDPLRLILPLSMISDAIQAGKKRRRQRLTYRISGTWQVTQRLPIPADE